MGPDIKVTTYSDGSDDLWSIYCAIISDLMAEGSFSQEEAKQSSTIKELK